MSFCAVFGCNNSRRNGNFKFFRFPRENNTRMKWVNACRRKDSFNLNTARICSVHFDEASFFKSLQQTLLGYSPKNCRKLRDDATPTLLLPFLSEEKGVSSSRRERHTNRAKRKLVDSLLFEDIPQEQPDLLSDIETCLEENEGGCNEQQKQNELQQLQQKIVELESEKGELMKTIVELERKNSELQDKINMQEAEKKKEEKKIHKILSGLFSPGQVKAILNPGKRIVWSEADVSAAISLRYVSAKAYRYLRNHLKFPLPCITTLKSWVARYDFNCGLQKSVLAIMNIKSRHLSDLERLTVISFDEMKISSEMCFDRKSEQVVGPCDQAQVVMVRSLFGKWKQPIYYDFDQPMTKRVLFSIVLALEQNGYQVVAQVSDLGPSNRGLWKELGVSMCSTSYKNPHDPNRQVFIFSDVPHLIKLLRNHLVDKGFILSNGKIVSVSVLEKLLSLQGELNLIPKITQEHLHPSPFRRQKVKLATQLLSNTVASALLYMEHNGILNDVSDASCFIKVINDFFDVFNSSVIYDKHGPRHAYGADLQRQDKILDNVERCILACRVVGSKGLQPFQQGIIINIRSLKNMFKYVSERHGVKYILTTKLNQDGLECFFSYIRGLGSAHDHPNAIAFKQRIRAYVMGKHSEAVFTVNTNTTDSSKEQCLISLTEEEEGLSKMQDEVCITVDILKGLIPDGDLIDQVVDDEQELNSAIISCGDVDEDALRYIAGYIASRFKFKYPWLRDMTKNVVPGNDWIGMVSLGGLVHPTEEFFTVLKTANVKFLNFHGEYINRSPYVFSHVTKSIMADIDAKWPEEVISCFVRTRTFIRLKYLNRMLKDNESGRALKKKLRKVKL